MRTRPGLPLLLLLAGALALPGSALAAPPANDDPAGAADFGPLQASTEDAAPAERQATAELAEATADPNVPRCLGDASFTRTVWFRVPSGDTPREVTVEASSRTSDPVDLALFVQGPSAGNLSEPNACAGEGAGGDEATEDRTTAVSLRVPAGRTLLVQVARRGAPGSAADERATLSLATTALPATARPQGDAAQDAPEASGADIALGGATTTEEDPAQPACPALGSVWRKLSTSRTATTVVTVDGEAASTLTVFRGARPTGDNAVTCVERERRGALQLDFAPGEGQVWLRIGTDRPAPDARATLRLRSIVDGGSPGSSPIGVVGGRGAPCVPRAQGRTRRTRTRVALGLAGRSQIARRRNRFRSLPLTLQTFRGPLCAVAIAVVGPRSRVYARATVARLNGRRAVRLRRARRLVPGRYRLRITSRTRSGTRARVLTTSRLRLR